MPCICDCGLLFQFSFLFRPSLFRFCQDLFLSELMQIKVLGEQLFFGFGDGLLPRLIRALAKQHTDNYERSQQRTRQCLQIRKKLKLQILLPHGVLDRDTGDGIGAWIGHRSSVARHDLK
ncbi:hypothetical protein NE237_019444 [Protea cynaroides]|uniref:Uncharacterized protein n=1 Tax=Protea cynaroides TaxID=273540 RepID=A0A9Q0KBW1_9MAGN|nr:hypothetical protein NE237_019444 [Protea cynaroides]